MTARPEIRRARRWVAAQPAPTQSRRNSAERLPWPIAALIGVMLAALAVLALRYLLNVAPGSSLAYDGVIYDIVSLTAAVACIARACLRSSDRLAWALIGSGLLVSGAGDVYYASVLMHDPHPPYPSPADIGYLAWYPLTAAGVVVLVRSRMSGGGLAPWLDGLIGAVTTGALVSAVLLEPALHELLKDDRLAAAVSTAYPVADVVLISLIVGTLSLNGWRVGRAWGLLLAGLAATAIGDAAYAGEALGQLASADWWQILWPTSCALIGVAAWQPHYSRAIKRKDTWRELFVPSCFAMAAIALLVDRAFAAGGVVTLLGAVAPILVVGRISFSALENRRLLEQTRTDFLTGLGNRALLLSDFEGTGPADAVSPPRVLALFDLDGFKLYNDTYGHPAGDALLKRLGGRLAAAVADRGGAYRIGGDEFCVLTYDGGREAEATLAAASAALHEAGEGFEVSCSRGTADIPEEATTASGALRIADRRMYQQKDSNRASARSQAQEVLLGALGEREPDLREHLTDVAELAREVALRMGVEGFALDEVERAAKLHDVGKVAVPEAILAKPGPLDADERAFIERHTILGERIVSAAPALAGLGPIIRSSHERWDGNGYPDRLKAEEIPLASRIIFVCDAFDAIRSKRPYSPSHSAAQALAEITRCAGTQFDPAVVAALSIELSLRDRHTSSRAAAIV